MAGNPPWRYLFVVGGLQACAAAASAATLAIARRDVDVVRRKLSDHTVIRYFERIRANVELIVCELARHLVELLLQIILGQIQTAAELEAVGLDCQLNAPIGCRLRFHTDGGAQHSLQRDNACRWIGVDARHKLISGDPVLDKAENAIA